MVASTLLAHFHGEGRISSHGLGVSLTVLVGCVAVAVGYMLKALRQSGKGSSSADQASASSGVGSERSRSLRPVQVLLSGLIVFMTFSLLWGLWEERHGPVLPRLGGIIISLCMITFFALALMKSRRR